ncbi:hypothetical protein B0T14DRAFT_577927 [Immersiella caudata]|uniref:Uncharacterized protein n=1 Tax=Immersiella caudata TaxID=314043 RepID=A0AA39X440_9PEZI|nr:hypothetical protein B0T14DRAFT_577927 [Immersiella caudata]
MELSCNDNLSAPSFKSDNYSILSRWPSSLQCSDSFSMAPSCVSVPSQPESRRSCDTTLSPKKSLRQTWGGNLLGALKTRRSTEPLREGLGLRGGADIQGGGGDDDDDDDDDDDYSANDRHGGDRSWDFGFGLGRKNKSKGSKYKGKGKEKAAFEPEGAVKRAHSSDHGEGSSSRSQPKAKRFRNPDLDSGNPNAQEGTATTGTPALSGPESPMLGMDPPQTPRPRFKKPVKTQRTCPQNLITTLFRNTEFKGPSWSTLKPRLKQHEEPRYKDVGTQTELTEANQAGWLRIPRPIRPPPSPHVSPKTQAKPFAETSNHNNTRPGNQDGGYLQDTFHTQQGTIGLGFPPQGAGGHPSPVASGHIYLQFGNQDNNYLQGTFHMQQSTTGLGFPPRGAGAHPHPVVSSSRRSPPRVPLSFLQSLDEEEEEHAGQPLARGKPGQEEDLYGVSDAEQDNDSPATDTSAPSSSLQQLHSLTQSSPSTPFSSPLGLAISQHRSLVGEGQGRNNGHFSNLRNTAVEQACLKGERVAKGEKQTVSESTEVDSEIENTPQDNAIEEQATSSAEITAIDVGKNKEPGTEIDNAPEDKAT